MTNALTSLPETFQECREYRHPWQDSNIVQARSELEQVQICPRCGNTRSRILSLRKTSYGHIVRKWQIKYEQKTYLLKRDQHVTADDWGEMRLSLLGFHQ